MFYLIQQFQRLGGASRLPQNTRPFRVDFVSATLHLLNIYWKQLLWSNYLSNDDFSYKQTPASIPMVSTISLVDCSQVIPVLYKLNYTRCISFVLNLLNYWYLIWPVVGPGCWSISPLSHKLTFVHVGYMLYLHNYLQKFLCFFEWTRIYCFKTILQSPITNYFVSVQFNAYICRKRLPAAAGFKYLWL